MRTTAPAARCACRSAPWTVSRWSPDERYDIPIPPVQIRYNECIGCQICARVCTQLTWDAILMLPIAEFEKTYQIEIDQTAG